MRNRSTTRPATGATAMPRRHQYAPSTACQSHLVLYGGNYCPNKRMNGLKLCRQCATEVAKSVPQGPRPLTPAEQRLQDVYRISAESYRREVEELRAEIKTLIGLTPAERHWRARGTPTDGTIYALLSGYNVKIGWTGRDLQDRLREYPPSTQLLVHFPGIRGDETRIKRKFAHLRTHGNEWFPYAPQVTEWIDQMVREHGDPDPDITCGPAKYQTPRPHSQQPVVKPRQWRGRTA